MSFVNVPTPCASCGGVVSFLAAANYFEVPGKSFCSKACMEAYTGKGPEPIDDDDDDEGDDEEGSSMTFEEAVALAELINESVGWSAEIAASGMDDWEYITVQAVFDLFGLIYRVDLENVEEWEYHLNRLANWVNTTHPQKERKG